MSEYIVRESDARLEGVLDHVTRKVEKVYFTRVITAIAGRPFIHIPHEP